MRVGDEGGEYAGEEARALLVARLEAREWMGKREGYAPLLEFVRLRPSAAPPKVSIVIIAWRGHQDVIANLEILEAQRAVGFELIFVDNGSPSGELESAYPFADVVVRLNRNTGAFLARNFGSVFSAAPILLFLDDDGLAAPDIVEAHLEAFRTYDCTSVRGVCRPKTDNPLNRLALHYDWGDRPFPQYPVIEGNTSFEAQAFFRVGGWDDEIRFGFGGTELARRLVAADPDLRRLIYYPRAWIRHDYVRDAAHLDAKAASQAASFERLAKVHPDLRIFRYVGEKFLFREDLLLPRVDCRAPAPAAAVGLPPGACDFSDELSAALERVGWLHEGERLARSFVGSSGTPKNASPHLSIVIVSSSSDASVGCLRALAEVRDDAATAIELIAVIPGAAPQPVSRLADRVVEATPESSLNARRNLGATFATAPILLFLEDRNEPARDLVAAHLGLHTELDVIAVQGAIKPLSDSEVNCSAGHYAPAEETFPLFADADSNTSYRADAFFRAGGWDENLAPEGAGFALARALARSETDLRAQIYSSRPVVRRDEAADPEELALRRERFAANLQRMRAAIWDFSLFLEAWDRLADWSVLLRRRGHDRYERRALETLDAYLEEPDYFAAVDLLAQLVDRYPAQLYTTFRLRFWRYLVPPTSGDLAAARRRDAEAERDPARKSESRDFAAAVAAIKARLRDLPWFNPESARSNQRPISIFCIKVYESEPPAPPSHGGSAPEGSLNR